LGTNVFFRVNKTTCILKVPAGSESAYSTAAQWKDFINIVGVTTAIENVYLQNLILYPNPVKDELKIENGDLRIDKVEIYDLSGKVINSRWLNSKSINVTNLSQGIYFVKIETDKGILIKKILTKNLIINFNKAFVEFKMGIFVIKFKICGIRTKEKKS